MRPLPRLSDGVAYTVLMTAQTAAAVFLFLMVFPIFHSLVTHLGERQVLDFSKQIAIVAGAALLHCCYWTRLKWVPVTPPFHSSFVAHLFFFASRVSFFFAVRSSRRFSSGTFRSSMPCQRSVRQSSRPFTSLEPCSVFSATRSSLTAWERPSRNGPRRTRGNARPTRERLERGCCAARVERLRRPDATL